MANPLGALSSIPIMSTIMGMLQSQANLRATQVGTDMEQAKLGLLNQQMQLDNQYREAMLRGDELNPAINNPKTVSIDSSQQTQLGGSPMGNVLRDLQQERSKVMQDIALTERYPSTTALAQRKSLQTRLDSLDTNIREASKAYNDDRIANLDRLGSVFGAVDSPAALNSAMNQLYSVDPNRARLVENNLPHDPVTGERLWNQMAKNAVGQYAASNLKTKDSLELQDKAREYNRKLDEDVERRRHDRELEKEASARVAVEREGIRSREKIHEEVLRASGIKFDRKAVDTTQKEIDTLARDSKLGDFKAAADVASRVESKLVDPKQGYASVTTEDARQLVEQAKRLQQNFRSFGGTSKLTEQEVRNMNSFLEKYEKWFQSIGKGDPILSKDQMLNLTESMKQVYADRNAEQVKQELQRGKVLADRGMNPEWVTTRGNIDDLKEAGRAYEVNIEGKPYLAILPPGKKKEQLTKKDFYAIPQAPERPPTMILE